MRLFKSLFLCISLIFSSMYASDNTQITLQFQWKHQFQFAGYYVALEKGFYKDAGFDVKLKEWKSGIDMTEEVLQGRADFAVARPSTIIDKAHGKDIVALYATYQASPLVYMTNRERGIESLRDFEGKKVMTTSDLSLDASLMAMIQSEGVNFSTLIPQKPTFNVQDLIAGKTDVILSYAGNEPYELESYGYEPVIFDPKDYGFDFYNDLLITSQAKAQNDSIMVQKFIDASLKGWRYAFNNIHESAQIIYNKYNTQKKTKEALIYEGKVLKEYAYGEGEKLGTLDKEKIQRIYDIYKVLGLVKNKLNIDEFLFNSPKYQLGLTNKELNYLKHKKTIKMCNNYDFVPIEFKDKDGMMKGIALDVVDTLTSKLNLNVEFVPTESWIESIEFLKQKKCDLLPAAHKTGYRQTFANFTKSYLDLDLVIIGNANEKYAQNYEKILQRKGVRKKGSAIIDVIKMHNPEADIFETDSIKSGFDAVNDEKVYYTVATLPVYAYYLQKYRYENLHIIGYLPTKYELAMAVRDDDHTLLHLLNKGLSSIKKDEYETIKNRWTRLQVQNIEANYSFAYKIIGGILFVAFLILLNNLLLRKEKQKAQNAVAQKKESLETLNLALDIANLSTLQYNILSDEIILDAKLQTILALKNRSNLKEFISLVPNSEQNQLHFEVQEALMTNQAVLTEHYIMTKQGRYNYVNINFKVVKHTIKGHPLKIVATILNLTKYKELEGEFLKAKEDAESAARAKSNFLANMSHELRTPLNVISGMSYLIKKEGLTNQQQHNLEKLEAASNSLLSIINDILDFSRIETGKLQIERLLFNLKDLILSSIAQIQTQADEKGLKIELRYEDIPQNFYADSYKITQIMQNLLSNALKFTHEGKITVVVSYIENDIYQISVNDTGVGLSKNQVKTLFDEFSQLDQSSTKEYGGVGIGLALCKQMIELLGGKIWVQSTLDVGSSFVFELPLQQSQNDNASARILEKTEDINNTTTLNESESILLWEYLQDAIQTKRPKNYLPIIEKLVCIKLNQKDSKKLNQIKEHLKNYDFTKALKVLND